LGPLLKRDVKELERVLWQAAKPQWCEERLRDWVCFFWQRGATGCSRSRLPSLKGWLQRV